eukprot:SAG31_NODE_832_length_11660_cov_2.612091_10_plen_50_part_01
MMSAPKMSVLFSTTPSGSVAQLLPGLGVGAGGGSGGAGAGGSNGDADRSW